jgi:hypothetical protein
MEQVVLEFLYPSGQPIRLLDLGLDFLGKLNLDPTTADRPFRIGIGKKKSKAGNWYYEYQQNGVPLPAGMETYMRVEGTLVPMGSIRPAKRTGNPTREGAADIQVGGVTYQVHTYLTQGKTPYWVRIIAHKKPDVSKNLAKGRMSPRGGTIL